MNEYEYKEIMKEFYAKISDFLSNLPEVLDEIESLKDYFRRFNLSEEEIDKFISDWCIFDYKSSVLSKTILEYFLENVEIDEYLKSIYSRFKEGIFSVFEVISLQIGKEMVASDLTTKKEYYIKDTTLTKHILKGQCGILRVLPFKDFYILTGPAYFFPQEVTQFIKLFFIDAEKIKKPFSLTPFEIFEIFFSQKKEENLPPLERFILLCQEVGLKKDYINQIIQRIRKEALNKGNPDDILKELIFKIGPHPRFDIKEITQRFIDVWNNFILQNTNIQKGPIETALIYALMNYVSAKVNPKKFKDKKSASKKAEKIAKEWLKLPQEQLNGKTPEEVILEERQRLGNPQKNIEFHINITELGTEE